MTTLLAVDGNSLVHRAFHAKGGGYRTPGVDRGWAVKGLLRQICAAVERSGADRVLVGFDDPRSSLRRDTYPGYKAQRAEKAEALAEQLDTAAQVCAELGFAVVVPPGLEADDVLASAAQWAAQNGAQAVLVTSDRDSFALIDEHTRVLRIINGGVENSPMLTPARLPLLVGVSPHQYPDLAALRGDPSDNLPGVSGIGPKTGARLLAEFGDAAGVFEAAGQGRCAGVVGPALERRLQEPESRLLVEHNREVMRMRRDVPLDLLAEQGLLPRPEPAVRCVFTRFELPARPALRALCGTVGEPHPADLTTDWLPAPWAGPRRHPPLRPRADRQAQLTLF